MCRVANTGKILWNSETVIRPAGIEFRVIIQSDISFVLYEAQNRTEEIYFPGCGLIKRPAITFLLLSLRSAISIRRLYPGAKSTCHRWYESKQPPRWTLLTCAYSNLWVYFILVVRTKLVYTGSVYSIPRIMYRTKEPESFVVKLYRGIATTYMQWDVDNIAI